MNTISLIIVTELLVILAVLGFSFYVLMTKYNRVKQFLLDFIAPKGENQSDLANTIGILSSAAGKQIAQEIASKFMGKESGQSRLENAVQGDMIQDAVASQNPMLGMILSAFPKVAKRAAKNPAALGIAMEALSKFKLGSLSGPGSNGGTSPLQTRLKNL